MSNQDQTRPNRLGRGLSALLGGVDETPPTRSDGKLAPSTLPIAQLTPSPLQPRRFFDEQAMSELTSSVKEKGVLQPVLVRPSAKGDGSFEIVAGERRWRAAQRAGVHEVPIIIRDLTDGQVLEIALIENVQRADLNGIDEARGYKRLIEQFRYTQDQLAKVIGKSRPHIANTLRLLSLPASVQAHVESGALTAGHVRTLVGRLDAEALAEQMVKGGLSVRAAEELVRGPEASPKEHHVSPPKHEKDADTLGLEKSISDSLGLKVLINDKGEKGGEVRITYKTLEQLEDVCNRLQHAH
ncbi:MAG TPA: ParB/RepB/Spo0J family partition protein [Alphaproteobacteria bacterium]|nr:ParB/RepB/Spo0J family partition protein [Alphaproteobacteria bacterium]